MALEDFLKQFAKEDELNEGLYNSEEKTLQEEKSKEKLSDNVRNDVNKSKNKDDQKSKHLKIKKVVKINTKRSFEEQNIKDIKVNEESKSDDEFLTGLVSDASKAYSASNRELSNNASKLSNPSEKKSNNVLNENNSDLKNNKSFSKSESLQKTTNKNGEKDNKIREEEFFEKCFKLSETPEEFREEWFSNVKKAKSSKKKNFFVKKVLSGKFRINKDGKIEILPDLDIYNKSSKDILLLSKKR